MTADQTHDWMELLSRTLSAGPPLLHGVEQFDTVSEHVLAQLSDATLLFSHGSYPTAAFVAITALEETAKLVLGSFRKGADPAARGRDPLYRHQDKHALAAGPFPLQLRQDLVDALGEDLARSMIELAMSGELRWIRESAVYFESTTDEISLPRDAVPPDLSRAILLFALHCYLDQVVGWTNASIEHGEQAEALFASVVDAG